MTAKEMESLLLAMRAELDELNALPEIATFKKAAHERRINLESARREQELKRAREAERLAELRREIAADPLIRVEYSGAGGSGVTLQMFGDQFHDAWSWGLKARDHHGLSGTHARQPTARFYRKSDWRQVQKESDGQIKQLIREGLVKATELDPNEVILSGEMRTHWERSRVRAS